MLSRGGPVPRRARREAAPRAGQPDRRRRRPQGDGRGNAFVKLLAGILDVNYDDLVKRRSGERCGGGSR